MDKKVIVAGHICLDITPVFPAGKKKSISEVMMPGKLVQMNAASVSTGGAVANTGLAMKILGANVKLMGKVGKDAFGDMVCSIMDRYDAGEAMIRAEGEATSYTVVVAVPGIAAGISGPPRGQRARRSSLKALPICCRRRTSVWFAGRFCPVSGSCCTGLQPCR